MKRITFFLILALSSQLAYAAKYTGCSDPKYIRYVEKRVARYERLDRENYEDAQRILEYMPFEELDENTLEIFLRDATVFSARFDTKEIALRNIKAYEDVPPPRVTQ